MKLLLVEDSPDQVKLIKTILNNSGYNDINTAGSAEEAYNLLGINNNKNKDKYDLILLDNLLPGDTGLKACKKIKNTKKTKDIPVIIITVSNDDDTITNTFKSGAVDYIAKPFRKAELLARIGSAIKTRNEIKKSKDFADEIIAAAELMEQANQHIIEFSSQDDLTQIGNRRVYEVYLEKEWKRACKAGISISAIMIDIDYFKNYNDSYGHQAGDKCLFKVAQTIKKTLSRKDDMVARYGGEEFVVILPNTDTNGAFILSEKIRKNIEQLAIPHKDSKAAKYVTISAGCFSLIPGENITSSHLIHAADKALYQAKKEGRNKSVIFQP